MTSTHDFDVLVVGLGPAGASAAAECAKAGLSVLAIDRKPRAGHPVQCAEFVPSVVGIEVDNLKQVCLQQIDSMHTFVEADAPDLMKNFPGQIIDRRAFDAQLTQEARSAGVDCRLGTSLKSLAPDGLARLSDGGSVKPRLIIGADGPHSIVGEAIGEANTDMVETRQIRVPLTNKHSATDIFLCADIAGGYGWLFPREDHANLGVGVRPEDRQALKPLLDALHKRLIHEGRVRPEILGHTGGAIPVGGMRNPVGALMDTTVILAGDAAGLTNPITGAGISSAVISGHLAGEFGSDWLGGESDALNDYAEELEFLFGSALKRALDHRRRVLKTYETGGPSPKDLRSSWVAYPEFWAA